MPFTPDGLSGNAAAIVRSASGAARVIARNFAHFRDPAERRRWDTLAKWAVEPNPFYESWYLLPSLDALDPSGSVRLLCVEMSGQLIGLLPVVRARRYYGRPMPNWQAWVHSNIFCALPLVAAGAEKVFWRAVLDWVDETDRTALFLHLPQLPLHGPLHAALREVLDAEGRPAKLVHCYERAVLQSELSPEAYFAASVSPKRRKEYRRQIKRLDEQGSVTFERCRDNAGIEDWTEEFLALEHAGWKGKQGSALACDPDTAALFHSALRGAAQRGRLERLTLRCDGRAIAMLATFLTPPGAFSFKTAYDETFASSSPGVQLQQAYLDILADDQFAWTDSCAAPGHPMIDHFWRERRAIGRLNVAVGGTARRALFKLISRFETGPTEGPLA
jgi:CelD/BcsL family acetyltransferase involved in cellulose biosynthesis